MAVDTIDNTMPATALSDSQRPDRENKIPLATLNGAQPITAIAPVLRSLQDEVNAAKAALQLMEEPAKPQLITYLRDTFSDAERARISSGVEEMLLDCQRRRIGQYSPEESARLKKYQMPEVWFPHTRIKCELTEAQIKNALTEDFWYLEPFAVPAVTPAMAMQIRQSVVVDVVIAHSQGMPTPSEDEMQAAYEQRRSAILENLKAQASDRSKRKQGYVNDMLRLGKFMRVLRSYWSNKITFGTGFIAGPDGRIVRIRDDAGAPIERLIPAFEDFGPLDAYPAPWSIEIEDGYFYRRCLYGRQYLTSKISRPGRKPVRWWNSKEIAALLMDHPRGNIQTLQPDSDRASMEQKDQGTTDNRFDCRRHYGTISGSLLLDWQIEGVEADGNYSVDAIFSGDKIPMVRTNWHDMDLKQVVKSCFKRRPGSFWGEGMAMRLKFPQDEANFIKTCEESEMEWLAQPLRFIQQDRLVDPNDISDLHPGKFIPVHKPLYNDQSKVYEVVEQTSHQQDYQVAFERTKQDSDLCSAVPAIMQGSDKAAGAGRTYSGAAMMRGDAQLGVRDALVESDEWALQPALQMACDYVTEFAADLGIDDQEALSMRARAMATGASGLVLKEQKIEKISGALDRLMSPIAMAAMGPQGPAIYVSLLRQYCDLLNLDMPELPSETEIAQNSQKVHAMVLAKLYGAGGRGEPAQQPAAGPAQPMTSPGAAQPAQQPAEMVSP